MDITDQTIEDVLVTAANRGQLPMIVLGFIVGVIIGALLTVLYFRKFKYYKLINDLNTLKSALSAAESARDDFKAKYAAEKARSEKFRDAELAHLATAPDSTPLPPL